MKKNDVVTVITMAGEFVGKFVEKDESGVHLTDPRMVVQGPNGEMGFARGICQTGVESPEEQHIQNYVFLTETNEQVEKAYRTHTSGIELV